MAEVEIHWNRDRKPFYGDRRFTVTFRNGEYVFNIWGGRAKDYHRRYPKKYVGKPLTKETLDRIETILHHDPILRYAAVSLESDHVLIEADASEPANPKQDYKREMVELRKWEAERQAVG